jgi:hypothetical protein
VCTKDSCWSVGIIYDPRELPGVSTVDLGLDGVLHVGSSQEQLKRFEEDRLKGAKVGLF